METLTPRPTKVLGVGGGQYGKVEESSHRGFCRGSTAISEVGFPYGQVAKAPVSRIGSKAVPSSLE